MGGPLGPVQACRPWVCRVCHVMAHPDFGRSVNPISTMGDRLCPHNYYWHSRIFRPSDGPAVGPVGRELLLVPAGPWELQICLTKIIIFPTLKVGWSDRPKHQLMLDFVFPPNLVSSHP